jgi:hypothetical protein
MASVSFFMGLDHRKKILEQNQECIFHQLQQQIRDAFDAVPVEFVRKSVECLSYELQKCVQDVGASVQI